MTIRAILSLIISIILMVGGVHLILRFTGASLDDYFSALFFQTDAHPLRCFFFALGALVAAVLALLSCVAAFMEDEHFDEYEHEEFPIGAIPFFIVAGLGLFFFALGCSADASEPDAEPIEFVAPEPAPEVEPQPVYEPVEVIEPEPEVIEPIEEVMPTPAPQTAQLTNVSAWPYKYPLVRDGAYVHSSATDNFLADLMPISDPTGEVRNLICGKAWVAVTGASSEEGPQMRNHARARVRAELAVDRLEAWVAQHPDCGEPVILGVDLGQHVSTSAGDVSTSGSTAYQRQVLFVLRAAASEDEQLSSSEALAELSAYLTSETGIKNFLGQREYDQPPAPFGP